ncbi:GNAT family N-acetyltransferase [Anoxybacillus flavithermus]|uniref:GNAT family N-acetyltransferase n=1 Tax=Anoxybacillus flavithermus TaxID=33934 RepID=A0A2G5RM03_9BACL|nr:MULTISPECIES: GNAT family N-acetyltransferase [Anoxybacillus]KFZ43727.1 hypothetical protein JS80_01600 [Anoxybacillus sp. KU2-6(11)]PIC03701.1 GNAT family N-acetyltransferase [Anoxybacillus flavithermus]
MTDKIQVRLANLKDIDILLNLTNETFQYHKDNISDVFNSEIKHIYSYEEMKKLIEDNNKVVALAENQKFGCIGYVIAEKKDISKIYIFKQKNILYIKDLGVTQSMRGKGIGSALIKWIESWSYNNNIDEIQLNVWTENFKAVEFYQYLGFNEIKKTYIKQIIK